MAKRYHKSFDAGMDRGEEREHDMAGRELDRSDIMKYASQGKDPRRRSERRDSHMIEEDHSAPANLPQRAMIKYWPSAGRYTPEQINDGIGGVDFQMDYDSKETASLVKPRKA